MIEDDSEFHRACRAELRKPTFNTLLNENAYAVEKEILSKGKSKICFNCMYCDKIHSCCMATKTERVKKKLCWKANNIRLLKESGYYGQTRNRKTGVD